MSLKAPPAEYLWAVTGGLLASSCCVLQLVFNALSVGCAGFSALTPYRPAFLGLTAASLAYTHSLYNNRRRSVLALALALALASTPELVHVYNTRSWCWPQVLCSRANSEPVRQQVELQVDGLKCVSCAMRLKQHIQTRLSSSHASCHVDFPSGKTTVLAADVDRDQLVSLIQQQGYRASLIGQRSDVSAPKADL